LLTRSWDGFYVAVVVTTLTVLGSAIGLASTGISTPLCLLVVTAAPAVVVCGFEFLGHQRTADALARSRGAVHH